MFGSRCFAVVLGLSLMMACGSSGNIGHPVVARTNTPVSSSPKASPTETPDLALSCLSAVQTGGGGVDAPAPIKSVRLGHQSGYDRFVLEFVGPAVPHYEVTPQPNATFVEDASGRSVSLAGNAGLRVVVHGAKSSQETSVRIHQVGEADSILEAEWISDFEGVVTWGLGVRTTALCFRAFTLTDPARLVVDVQN